MELLDRDHPESPRRLLLALLSMMPAAWAGSFLRDAVFGVQLSQAYQAANFTVALGAVPALVLGLSAHALLRTSGWCGWIAYGAAGVLAGSGTILVLFGMIGPAVTHSR